MLLDGSGARDVPRDRRERPLRVDRPGPAGDARGPGPRRRTRATSSRARPPTWPTTCSCWTRSTSARAGFRRCASGRGCPATSRWPPRSPTSGASAGRWSPSELRALRAADVAAVLGQEPDHELMGLYAEALRDLGRFLGARRALDLVAEAEGSAERLASMLAAGMPFFDDRGLLEARPDRGERPGARRRGRVRRPRPPHDLRRQPRAPRAARGRRAALRPRAGGAHRRRRAAAARRRGAGDPRLRGARVRADRRRGWRCPPRLLDTALWNKGQAPRYKSVPRHRTRTVFY